MKTKSNLLLENENLRMKIKLEKLKQRKLIMFENKVDFMYDLHSKENLSEKVTVDDFHKNTKTIFEICETPNIEPDYISDSGSKYWYTDSGVFREADHWGDVATCSWFIVDSDYEISEKNLEKYKRFAKQEDESGRRSYDEALEFYLETDLIINSAKNYNGCGYSEFSDFVRI